MNQKIKISQLPAKGSNLAAADLLEIAEFTGTGYISKSITGQELIDAIPAPTGFVPTSRTLTINGTTQDLSADRTFTISTGITIGTTAITSGTVGRVLFQGTGNVVSQSANLFWDATNNRLGVGTSSPISKMQVITDNATSPFAFSSQTSQIAGTTTAGVFSAYSLTNGGYLNCGNPDVGWVNMTYLAGRHIFSLAGTEAMRITGGNLLINTTTDAGFRLDVNGTARVQGNTTVSLNQNLQTSLTVSNTTSGASAASFYIATSSNGSFSFGKNSAAYTSYKILASNDSVIYNATSGDISILNDFSTGRIKFAAGSASTAQMTLFSTGNFAINTTTDAGFRLDVNGTARVQGAFSALNASTQGIMLRNDYTQFPAIEWWATTYRAGITRETNNGLTTDAGGFAMHTVGAGTLIGGVNRFDLNASAQLQVQSTTKGFLPPRMTTTQRNAIASPAAGLQVFDTTLNMMSYYNGTIWISL